VFGKGLGGQRSLQITDEVVERRPILRNGAVSLEHVEARLPHWDVCEFARCLCSLQEPQHSRGHQAVTFCTEHSEAARKWRPLPTPHEIRIEREAYRLLHVGVRHLLVLL